MGEFGIHSVTPWNCAAAQLRCQEAQGEDTEKWGHQAAAQKGTWSPGGGRKFLLLSWSTHRIPPRERKAKKEVGSHQRELPCRLEKQQPPRTSTPPQPALSVARLSSRQRRGGPGTEEREVMPLARTCWSSAGQPGVLCVDRPMGIGTSTKARLVLAGRFFQMGWLLRSPPAD